MEKAKHFLLHRVCENAIVPLLCREKVPISSEDLNGNMLIYLRHTPLYVVCLTHFPDITIPPLKNVCNRWPENIAYDATGPCHGYWTSCGPGGRPSSNHDGYGKFLSLRLPQMPKLLVQRNNSIGRGVCEECVFARGREVPDTWTTVSDEP